MSPGKSDIRPEEPLTRVLPRWLVILLTAVAFAAFTAFLVGFLVSAQLRHVVAESELSRFFVALTFAVYFSIFFFVFYPQRIVLPRVPWLDWSLRLAGPLALMFVLLQVFLKIMPPASLLEIDGPSRDHHLFSKAGEPLTVPFFVRQGSDEKVRFEPLVPDELKSVSRRVEYVDDDSPLYLKTDSGFYLGQVELDQMSREIGGTRYLRSADRLRLGLYFGKASGEHRGRTAVSYLLPIPATDSDVDEREVQAASGVLYELLEHNDLRRCREYAEVAEQLRSYPTTSGSSHFQAIAETYFKMRQTSGRGELDGEPVGPVERTALRYYLEYLGRVEDAEPTERGLERWHRSINNAQYLLTVANLEPEVRQTLQSDLSTLSGTGETAAHGGDGEGVQAAADRHDAAQRLLSFALGLDLDPVTCTQAG